MPSVARWMKCCKIKLLPSSLEASIDHLPVRKPSNRRFWLQKNLSLTLHTSAMQLLKLKSSCCCPKCPMILTTMKSNSSRLPEYTGMCVGQSALGINFQLTLTVIIYSSLLPLSQFFGHQFGNRPTRNLTWERSSIRGATILPTYNLLLTLQESFKFSKFKQRKIMMGDRDR